MKHIIKLELSEKDIMSIVCERYGYDPSKCKINVSHLQGNQREPEQTTIILEVEIP